MTEYVNELMDEYSEDESSGRIKLAIAKNLKWLYNSH